MSYGEKQRAPGPRGPGEFNILNQSEPGFPGNVTQGYVGKQALSASPLDQGQPASPPRPRKVSIPRSPRVVSLGAQVISNIGTQQPPFPPSRGGCMFTADTRTGPTLECFTTGPQNPYAYPAPAPSLTRCPGTATMPAPVRTQGGKASVQTNTGTEGPYVNPLSDNIFFRGPQSGGKNPNIRRIPVPTEHGYVYVPVDVQAASIVADKKRARDAAASTRFRQRKKEKEREANSNIQKLEAQSRELKRRVRELTEERDFYRAERDRYREVVYQIPSLRELALQSPLSPRLRNASYPPLLNGLVGHQTLESGYAPPSNMQSFQGSGNGPVPTLTNQLSTTLPPLRIESVATPSSGVVTSTRPLY